MGGERHTSLIVCISAFKVENVGSVWPLNPISEGALTQNRPVNQDVLMNSVTHAVLLAVITQVGKNSEVLHLSHPNRLGNRTCPDPEWGWALQRNKLLMTGDRAEKMVTLQEKLGAAPWCNC